MNKLLLATAIWAFSFSLIGVYLAGKVDPYFSALLRTALAFVVFLPFIRKTKATRSEILSLMKIGGIQLGLMYIFYYKSFELLTVPEVLIFTIFTPIYVTLINDLHDRHFSLHYLISTSLAVAGTAIIRWNDISSHFICGCLLIQATNICFAYGQIAYKRLNLKKPELGNRNVFGYFYLGAFIVTLIAWLTVGSDKYPTNFTQWGVLTWLGIVASGAGYFIWNQGAKEVNAGRLAIMNNALVPAGLLVNLIIWNRDVDIVRLSIGTAVILLSLFVNEKLRLKAS